VELAQSFAPSKKAQELLAEAREWRSDPEVVKALQAKALLDAMTKTADNLRKKLGGKKASDPVMAAKHAQDIALVARYAYVLREKYAETASGERAMAIVEELGIELPEKK
jgi:hypothetical protein